MQTHVRYNDRGIKRSPSIDQNAKTSREEIATKQTLQYVPDSRMNLFSNQKQYNIKNHLWQVCYRNSNIKERIKLNRVSINR